MLNAVTGDLVGFLDIQLWHYPNGNVKPLRLFNNYFFCFGYCFSIC